MNEISIKRPGKTQIASRWRAIDQLAADADEIIRCGATFSNLHRNVRDHAAALKAGQPLTKPPPDEREAKLSAYHEKLVQRCNEAIEALDPETNYEDSDREADLRRDVISVRLAMLVGSFPAGAPGDPEVFVTVMLEHICAIEGLSFIALDAACRQITTSQKFLPAISEVVEALEEQQELWDTRVTAIWQIAGQSRRIVADIREIRPQWEATAAARAEKEARGHLTFVQGLRTKAIADAVAAQQRAATAAQEVAAKMAWLAQTEARILDAAEKLAAAVERLADSEPDISGYQPRRRDYL
jgi:hypothetical protein